MPRPNARRPRVSPAETSTPLSEWMRLVTETERVDLSSGLTAPEPATTAAEPAWAWRPRRGHLARVTIPAAMGGRVHGVQDGEVVMIDDTYGMEDVCERDTCTMCNQIDLLTARPGSIHSTERWMSGYTRCSQHLLMPLLPERGQAVTVRCEADSYASSGLHYGNHVYVDGCINPVRAIGANEDMMTVLSELNTDLFAEQLAARDTARAERTQRAASMRVGHEYRIDAHGYSLHGFTARITGERLSTGEFPCAITYPNGEPYRFATHIEPHLLGARIFPWSRRNIAPAFIQFATPTYALIPTPVTDREVAGVQEDQHECDHSCFEYGCSHGPSADWDSDQERSYDDEPDEYVDDIPIMPYSHTPRLIFSGDGPVYLGTELELSCGDGSDADHKMRHAATTLLESPLRNLVYLKSDASIAGRGFEAVFHPMSYDWILENWPVDLLRRMRADGAMPHSSCGMHVHVSRSGFSGPMHAFKWIKFMYRNGANISRMARRDPSHWGTFRAVAERDAAKWHAKGGYGGQARYVAINCIPRNTYEVRIFASTLNRTRLLGSLGLVDASVEYTRQVSTQDILKRDGWGFAPFREFVHSFKKYQPLQVEMARLLDV